MQNFFLTMIFVFISTALQNQVVPFTLDKMTIAMEMTDTLAPHVEFTVYAGCNVKGIAIDEPRDDPGNRSNLSSISMDVAQSYNYAFHYKNFEPGSVDTIEWDLWVRDVTMNAKAHLIFTDVAGNRKDTVIECKSVSVDVSEILESINIYNDIDHICFYSEIDYIVNELIMSDINGNICFSDNTPRNLNMFRFNISGLISGVYIIRMLINDVHVTKKIII